VHQLVKIETDLNSLRYEGIPIGGLLGHDFIELQNRSSAYFSKSFKRRFNNFIKYESNRFVKKPVLVPISEIVYFQSGDMPHYIKIIESCNLPKKSLIIKSGKSKYFNQADTTKIGNDRLLKIKKWLSQNKGRIKSILQKYSYEKKLIDYLITQLILQLCRLEFWLYQLINSKDIKMVLGDFDRNRHSAPLFLAAKKLKIESVVIQHGVGNGEYGFIPVLANRIFVWGEMHQAQFCSSGISSENIHITGSPILELTHLDTQIIQAHRKTLNVEGNKLVVLAVNPVGNEDVRKQINTFYAAIQQIPDIKAFVKIHPSQDVNEILEMIPNENDSELLIFPQDYDLVQFLNLCDVLVTHNSGIADEAIAYGIPVIILDNVNLSPGNGLWLHKLFSIPMVKNVEHLHQSIKDALGRNNLDWRSISKKIYAKIGDAAASEIRSKIADLKKKSKETATNKSYGE
jgi:hypothetical protein